MARSIKVIAGHDLGAPESVKFLPMPEGWDAMDEESREEFLDELADQEIGDYEPCDTFVFDDNGKAEGRE